MLTVNQRDIVAGIIVLVSANNVQNLSILDVITMYELTRISVEEIDIFKNEEGECREKWEGESH